MDKAARDAAIKKASEMVRTGPIWIRRAGDGMPLLGGEHGEFMTPEQRHLWTLRRRAMELGGLDTIVSTHFALTTEQSLYKVSCGKGSAMGRTEEEALKLFIDALSERVGPTERHGHMHGRLLSDAEDVIP